MRRPQPLFRLIFLPLLLVVALSVAVLGWYAEKLSRRSSEQEAVEDLATAANLAAFRLEIELPGSGGDLKETCREMGLESVRRVTVVLPTGEVACDSALVERVSVGDLSRHPELLEALAGRQGRAFHQSRTLKRSFLYVAVPLRSQGKVVAALRLGLPYPEARQRDLHAQLLRAAAAIILLGAGALYLIARRITAPIESLTRNVDRFAAGDFKLRLALPPATEVAKLAGALNDMADQLEGKIADDRGAAVAGGDDSRRDERGGHRRRPVRAGAARQSSRGGDDRDRGVHGRRHLAAGNTAVRRDRRLRLPRPGVRGEGRGGTRRSAPKGACAFLPKAPPCATAPACGSVRSSSCAT